MVSFLKAFGLKDNPFGPRIPLPEIQNIFNMKDLYTEPLRVHKERALNNLIVRSAGRFEENYSRFSNLLEQEGYSKDDQILGPADLAFLIAGQKGSGKSTLTYSFVRYLQDCKNDVQNLYYSQPDLGEGLDSQIKVIQELEDVLIEKSKSGDHCCIVIDNLKSGAETAAFNLYKSLRQKERLVIFFLVTSDFALVGKNWLNSTVQVIQFRIKPLTVEQGLELIRTRMKYFRPKGLNLNGLSLFPFEETDIVDSLEAGVGEYQGALTIRQLNSTMYRVLRNEAAGRDPAFDIKDIANEDLSKHLIKLLPAYKELLAA